MLELDADEVKILRESFEQMKQHRDDIAMKIAKR